jgi:hypothetical protein
MYIKYLYFFFPICMAEAVESWRLEMLKDIKHSSTQNQSNLGLSGEEARMNLTVELVTSLCSLQFLVVLVS